MGTNINITVSGRNLLDQVRLQQAASRESQSEKEKEKRITNTATSERTKRLESEGLDADGRPSAGFSADSLDIDRRHGASRRSTGNLAHAWILGEKYDPPGTPGIIETAAPGTDQGIFDWPAWKGSRTGNYDVTSTKNNTLIGSGRGNSWVTFTGKGNEGLPPLPADIFVPTPEPGGGGEPPSVDYKKPFVGERYSMHAITSQRVNINFAIPCGNNAFILIYGFTSTWHLAKTFARSLVWGWYGGGGTSFRGYEQRDPVTGELLPGVYGPDPGDWLRGSSALNSFVPIPSGAAYDNDGTLLYSNGVWNFESFRGKSRKFKAYACNNNSVREISVPEKLKQIIDIAYPDAIESTVNFSYRYNFIPYPGYEIPSSPGISGDTGLKEANYYGSVFTPEVFESLNNVKSFTDPGTIKKFSSQLSWIMYDTSSGSYAAYQDTTPDIFETPTYWSELYREGLPFYHAYWIKRNEEPNYEIYDPDYIDDWVDSPKPRRIIKTTLLLNPERPPRPGAEDRPQANPETGEAGSYWEEDFITVWDWSESEYCRNMCLRLGFSASDLNP